MKESCSWQTVCSVSPDDDEKAKRDAGKWWKPWVSQPGGEQQLCAAHRRRSERHVDQTQRGRWSVGVLTPLCRFNCSGEQLRLPSVWEWQRGGRWGGHREERSGGTPEEEDCFSGRWAAAKQNTDGFKFLIESRFHCKAGRKWHESCTRVCQLAYNAWVTSSKTALKDLKKEKKTIKKEEKKRTKREMQKQQGEAAGLNHCCIMIVLLSAPLLSHQYALELYRIKI